MTATPSPPNPTNEPDGDPLGTGVANPQSDDPPRPDSASRSALSRIGLLAVAIASLVLLAVLATGGGDSTDAAAEADILTLAFLTDDGTTGTLSDYQGRPMVVNFFASWCPPCRAELPDFEAVHQAVGDEVVFLGVNQDFTEETWKAFVAESQVTYETVFQPDSEIWAELGTGAMPTTAFLNADGAVVEVWAGVLTDDKLAELIDQHLREPS